jgi:hypothetical protein
MERGLPFDAGAAAFLAAGFLATFFGVLTKA